MNYGAGMIYSTMTSSILQQENTQDKPVRAAYIADYIQVVDAVAAVYV